jgi:hypothetical protein
VKITPKTAPNAALVNQRNRMNEIEDMKIVRRTVLKEETIDGFGRFPELGTELEEEVVEAGACPEVVGMGPIASVPEGAMVTTFVAAVALGTAVVPVPISTMFVEVVLKTVRASEISSLSISYTM